ncbi:MAG: hypothetical protein H6750_20895 [Nitrospiraceae bacterium]|nr:hypothetical protein [Nitrospiraceae bacterium]
MRLINEQGVDASWLVGADWLSCHARMPMPRRALLLRWTTDHRVLRASARSILESPRSGLYPSLNEMLSLATSR